MNTTQINYDFMRRAIDISINRVDENLGGPFGCVIVKDGEIIAEGWNQVTGTNDPTAHGEIVAIRKACEYLKTFQLEGCDIYTSTEPCPMCLGAIYWSRPRNVFFGNTRQDAAKIGFDDEFIYEEIALPLNMRKTKLVQLLATEAKVAFDKWESKEDKMMY